MLPGLETGVRFEYYEQSDLRHGTSRVDRTALMLPNDEEIQQRTLNRNTLARLELCREPHMGRQRLTPYHDRFHTTIAGGDTDISTSRASGLGDVRLMARYQQREPPAASGCSSDSNCQPAALTRRLPTAASGGTARPWVAARSGTTDLLAGFRGSHDRRKLGFRLRPARPAARRPRRVFPVHQSERQRGVRWLNSGRFTPQLQLNLKTEGRSTARPRTRRTAAAPSPISALE